MRGWADALIIVNLLLATGICMKFYEITENDPALYLWLYITKPWMNVVAICAVQFTAALLIVRMIGDPWFSLPVSGVIFAIMFVCYRYQHNQSGWNLMREITEHLPGACPVCTLYRAGAFYKFRKPGDPVPEHNECEEKR
jgi:hypothetical protein